MNAHRMHNDMYTVYVCMYVHIYMHMHHMHAHLHDFDLAVAVCGVLAGIAHGVEVGEARWGDRGLCLG